MLSDKSNFEVMVEKLVIYMITLALIDQKTCAIYKEFQYQ